MFEISKHSMITDLYQLTMMAVYHKYKLDSKATFEMFFRRMPKNRSYMVFAGLEQVIDYIQNLKFNPEDIDYLKSHKTFTNVDEAFFEYLKNFKFECNVRAIEEGEIFFPNEPIIQVTGPLIQSQLIETYILSMINFQSMIATKASRIKYVAGDKIVLEFGARRAHSPYASVLGSRASYIGGIDGTSNVKAGMEFGIMTSGTVAHSFIMSFENEKEAYSKYSEVFPENTIHLVDTYDSIEGIKNAISLNKKMKGIRLDSGDLEDISKKARKLLDENGYQDTIIVGSGDLNEYKIMELIDNDAPFDSFGVGTELITSKDDPAMSGVYKLMEIIEDDKRILKSKFSTNKQTYPGKKEIYRIQKDGLFEKDIVSHYNEVYDGKKLLKTIFDKGKLVYKSPSLEVMREKSLKSLKNLSKSVKKLFNADKYRVEITKKLLEEQEKIKNKML